MVKTLNEMSTVWKDVPGYEGIYMVSDNGQVKSLARTRLSKRGGICPVPERILTQKTDKDGYKEVALTRNAHTRYHRVHRLVALAFIPNPHNFPVINHKDENPANNHVSNLEWCSISYNTSYSNYRISRPVIVDGVRYKSIREAARFLNTDGHALKYCIQVGKKFRRKHTITFAE